VIVGTSQVDITPAPGGELSGFAARTQPSVGVLDPLLARVLYLADGSEHLLWIHTDLIGLERELVSSFRQWAQARHGLAPAQVMLSATHTHSGPPTIHLQEAGTYDPSYVQSLLTQLQQAATAALARSEACQVVSAEGHCDLAVDRRGRQSAHTDPRVAALGWRRADGTFAAVLTNYPMHGVALGPTNRQISADVPGQVAQTLTRQLPGQPVALATNGACGNLNPPAEDVPFSQIQAWGEQIAGAVVPALRRARTEPDAGLRVRARTVPLPIEVLSREQIEASARQALGQIGAFPQWGKRYRRAVENWQRTMSQAVRDGAARDTREAELAAVRVGRSLFIGLNAEVFSTFTEHVRSAVGGAVYTIGYANGLLGYLPTATAYDEGGYEVETAHYFYNSFRARRGGFELVAQHAAALAREMLQ
jgi:neutral ceramidase